MISKSMLDITDTQGEHGRASTLKKGTPLTRALTNAAGGYAFAPGVFQYSAGVSALPGYRIERVRFERPPRLAEGFTAIRAHLAQLGRPPVALCACELRSPRPFSEEGFEAFNRAYAAPLQEWGLFNGETNPVARTNVCPDVSAPDEPSFHAFSFTVPCDEGGGSSFVVAGSGEAPEGRGNYRDHVIRPGDRSPEGLREKARWVLAEMERRMAVLGFGWRHATGTHLYTVYDVHTFLADTLVASGAAAPGLTWHFSRPPVADLDFEMDVRRVHHEYVL